MNLSIRRTNSVVTVFSFDVRMIFDICKNVKSATGASFSESFGYRIDASALRATYHPRKVVFFRQILYLLDLLPD